MIPGIVVANVESVIQQGTLLRVAQPEEARVWAVKKRDELEGRLVETLPDAFKTKQAVGVILLLRVAFIASDPALMAFRLAGKLIHDPRKKGSRDLLWVVARMLYG